MIQLYRFLVRPLSSTSLKASSKQAHNIYYRKQLLLGIDKNDYTICQGCWYGENFQHHFTEINQCLMLAMWLKFNHYKTSAPLFI